MWIWLERTLRQIHEPQFTGEVESGATKKYAIYSQTPSPSYSKINGDYMTDEKTTKELMKALIDFLRAKTEESKTDNEFTKRILLRVSNGKRHDRIIRNSTIWVGTKLFIGPTLSRH